MAMPTKTSETITSNAATMISMATTLSTTQCGARSADGAGGYLHGQNVGAPSREDFQFRNQARENAVADHTGQAFFHVQRVLHAADVPRRVFHADQQCAPAVLAKATMPRSTPPGEERSRLNSSVLPSGRFSRSRMSITRKCTLKPATPPGFRVVRRPSPPPARRTTVVSKGKAPS